MADERKIFPVETVLELVAGKMDANVSEIASFILGRSVKCADCAKIAGPLAAAWLAKWQPRFVNLEWKDGQSWESFVKEARTVMGDRLSITPMSGRMKAMSDAALDAFAADRESLARQTEATVALEKKVAELAPFREQAAAARKECDKLDEQIKTLKTEMGGLRRQAAEFQGKVAIAHDELMQNIKDAIKDGLKGLSIGAAIADTVEAAASAEASGVSSHEPEPEFGFGGNSTDSDGFGF